MEYGHKNYVLLEAGLSFFALDLVQRNSGSLYSVRPVVLSDELSNYVRRKKFFFMTEGAVKVGKFWKTSIFQEVLVANFIGLNKSIYQIFRDIKIIIEPPSLFLGDGSAPISF